MRDIRFENISYFKDGILIAENINFNVSGTYNLAVGVSEMKLKNILSLFTQYNFDQLDDSIIEGDIFINGEHLSASKICYIINQYALFDMNESVQDVLKHINKERAEIIIKDFPIDFLESSIGALNIEQTRIFDVMINLVALPPFIFIKNLEIGYKNRKMCLQALKKHLKHSNIAALVVDSIYDCYDGTVFIRETSIVSLNGKQSKAYHEKLSLSVFDTKKPEISILDEALLKYKKSVITKSFDYKKMYAIFKCQNLIEIKRQDMGAIKRLKMVDIYKFNFSQAVSLALRKYSLMIEKYYFKNGILKGVRPFIGFIFLIRIYQELNIRGNGDFLADIFYIFFHHNNYSQLINFILIGNILIQLYIKEFTRNRVYRIFSNIFCGEYNILQFKLAICVLFLCILSNSSRIIKEDTQYISFYINRTVTPGTYVLSMLIYMFFTQFITYWIIGKIFNIRLISINLLNALFFSMFFANIRSKRFREMLIGFFIALYGIIPLVHSGRAYAFVENNLLPFMFPVTVVTKMAASSTPSIFSCLILVYFYLFVYIWCCFRLSTL